jgi:hypothetical protein
MDELVVDKTLGHAARAAMVRVFELLDQHLHAADTSRAPRRNYVSPIAAVLRRLRDSV